MEKEVDLKSEWLKDNYLSQTVKLLSNRGAYGKVYVLDDPKDKENPKKALKVIERSPDIKQYEWMEESIKEIKILDILKEGPSIIKLLDANIEGNRIFLIMELAKESLYERLVDPISKSIGKSLDQKEILKLMKSLSESLTYARKNMIYHRDIKPDNILVMQNGNFKISDWGGSKIIRRIGTISHTSVIGTPIYEAPEVEKAKARMELPESGGINLEKADIYSCGILLIECCGIDRNVLKNNREIKGHDKAVLKTLKENVNGIFQKDLQGLIVEMCRLDTKIRWGLDQFEEARKELSEKYGEKEEEPKKNIKIEEKGKEIRVNVVCGKYCKNIKKKGDVKEINEKWIKFKDEKKLIIDIIPEK